ncbi:MAG: ABC transporter permease [Sulfobacillus acidophilus]|uniref:ABC transporter permease n=1 Tax=Sulfobacillus acidophilus TaxID=53633 RepID=A0A2T2WE78_9FIRM|nr:MAG: ABC transporter permease [Sulfobacillus acidophilus]
MELSSVVEPMTSSKLVERLRGLWLLGVLIAMVIVFGILAPGFLSLQNWVSTSVYATETLLLAIGETFVIATGGIDLSVGSSLGLSAITGSMVMAGLVGHASIGIILGTAVALGTGALIGFANGLIITKLRITPFITTLGMLGIAQGLGFLLSGGNDITNIPTALSNFGGYVFANFLGMPVLVTAVIAVISGVYLAKTRFGRRTFAIGSNREAARVAGIPIDRHLIKIYTLTGLLAGVGGVLNVARFAIGSPTAGQNDELNAIAAVVIGGASLFGGEGTIFGTTIGAIIVSMLVTALVILNVQAYWQIVATGAIIILAVYVDQLQRKRSER